MMKRLRIFEAHQDAEYCKDLRIPKGFTFPFDDMVYFHWDRYPLKSLPSSLHPKNLVELNLRSRSLETPWYRDLVHMITNQAICAIYLCWSSPRNLIFKMYVFLVLTNLSHSKHLAQIPNLSGTFPNWEILNIKGT